jgi:hypothetical protein
MQERLRHECSTEPSGIVESESLGETNGKNIDHSGHIATIRAGKKKIRERSVARKY